MFVHSEVTYGFNMPDEYDELKQFEADTDLSKARKTEDTIAVRYTWTVDASGKYEGRK